MALRLRQLTGTFGAEVTGVDLRGHLSPEAVHALTSAWSRHAVLVFKGQALTDADHVRFARHFGTLAVFGPEAGAADGPREIYRSSSRGDPALLRMNWFWHADGSHRAMPNKGVALRAIEVAGTGGETLFADMVAAFEALPETTRRRIEGLVALHSFAHMVSHCGLPPMSDEEARHFPPTGHPLVRKHGDGRRSLFLSPPYMERIQGLDPAQGRALVDELTAWATQERFVYRHRWQPGDLLMWDNHRTLHKVAPYDTGTQCRVMHGATWPGTVPVPEAGAADA